MSQAAKAREQELKKGRARSSSPLAFLVRPSLDVTQFTFDEIKAAPNRGWAPKGGRAQVGRTPARP